MLRDDSRFYSAEAWTNWMKLAARCFPRRGKGVRLTYTGNGVHIDAAEELLWRHPWSMKFSYEFDEGNSSKPDTVGHWAAYVWPGFVNGNDATIRKDVEGEETQVPLTSESPAGLRLDSWRNPLAPGGISVTADGELVYAPGEGYPRYFEKLGVRPAAKGGSVFDEVFVHDPNRTREIRACDTFLVTPRIALASDVTVLDPLLDSQSVRIESRFVNTYFANAKSMHELKSTSKFVPPREPTIEERMYGTAVEPQTDEIKMSTIWAVSPPDVGYEATVDQTWTLYPEYDVFWNLMHASKQVHPEVPNDPLTLRTGLAFGIADALFAAMLSPVNDMYAVIDAYFGSGDYSGRYWNI